MAVNLIPGEFSAFTIAVAILSGFIVFFGYVSMFIKERMFLSEACKYDDVVSDNIHQAIEREKKRKWDRRFEALDRSQLYDGDPSLSHTHTHTLSPTLICITLLTSWFSFH